MTTLREAAQQVLEALERYQVKRQDFDRFADEIANLRAALAQQAEPLINQCGETCERAKLCAVCASKLAEPAQEPEWEVRVDGTSVRKDRWQIGIRRIVALLWGNRREFEIDEVVEAVRGLVPNPYAEGDAAKSLDAALAGPVQEPVEPVATLGYARKIEELIAQRDALLEGYRKMKNVAASYSNFCDDNGTTRRLEREFDAADAIVRAAIKKAEGGQ